MGLVTVLSSVFFVPFFFLGGRGGGVDSWFVFLLKGAVGGSVVSLLKIQVAVLI